MFGTNLVTKCMHIVHPN